MERKYALHYAQVYLKQCNLPVWLPISRILEGGENEVFESYFDYSTSGPTATKTHQKEILTKTSKSVSIAYQNGDVKVDGETLFTAMKGFFTNHQKLISVIANRSREYLQELRKHYQTTYGKDLVEQVRSETSFNFSKILVGLRTFSFSTFLNKQFMFLKLFSSNNC